MNKIFFFRFLNNQRGQSAVEYLIVSAAIIAGLITLPSIYDTMSHTMQNKYKSYAFGISISDPPTKHFDDTVKQDIDKVSKVLDTLKALWDIGTGSILPDIFHGKMPSTNAIKAFIALIKSLF